MEREMESRAPSIIDLNAELAKLTMFRGLTPTTTRAERRDSATLLGPYRDGILFAGKNAGTSHWEDHAEDELVHVLDGTKMLDIVCDDGPPKSFEVRAGMIAIVPKGTWHRFRDLERDASRRPHRARCRRPADGRAKEGHAERNPQHHQSQRGTGEADHVPWADPAIDDGGSQGKRRALGFLPRRRPLRDQVRRDRALGVPPRRRRADSHSRRYCD